MEKLTQQKFTEYKNDLDGKNTGSSDYMNDYAKVEKIITQGVKNHPFLGLITTKFAQEINNTAH